MVCASWIREGVREIELARQAVGPMSKTVMSERTGPLVLIVLLVWPHYANDLYLILLGTRSVGMLWILDLIVYTLIPAATLFVLIRRGTLTLAGLGLGRAPRVAAIVLGVTYGILSYFFMMVILSYLRKVMPWHLLSGYDYPPMLPLRWVTVIYAALSAGLLEEVIYRGAVISQLRRKISSGGIVVLLSCLIFSGIHWGEGPSKVIATFLWGIVPGAWFHSMNETWGLIAAHTCYLLICAGVVPLTWIAIGLVAQ